MKKRSVKASDLRAALWAGAMGYVFGFYAQSSGLDHLGASSSATMGSGKAAIAMGSGMVAAGLLDRWSIGAGVLFFAVSLCFRFYVPHEDRTTLSLSNLAGETKWPLRRTIVCIVILFDLIPSAGFDQLQRHIAMSRVALRVPISFRRGEFTTPLFDTHSTGAYSLALMFEGAFDPHVQLTQKERCQLGLPEGRVKDCAGIARIIDFNWKVVGDDGVVLQQGPYPSPAEPGPWIALGQFQAERGKPKRIDLNFVRDAHELDVFRPVLSVLNMTPGYWESEKVALAAGWYFLYAGLLSEVLVLILLISLLWQGLSWAANSARNRLKRRSVS